MVGSHPSSILLVSAAAAAGAGARAMCTSTSQLVARTSCKAVDVDCNLFHQDLFSLQGKVEENQNPWNILEEDDTEGIAMISPSSTIAEARTGIQKLKAFPPSNVVKTTVGVHPYHVREAREDGNSIESHCMAIQEIALANKHLVSAIGECGLDASDGFPPLEEQLPWFRAQIDLAEEMKLPLFVHERLAFDQTIDLLGGCTVPVIVHCFTGNRVQCREYIKRGYSISLSGFILKGTEEAKETCLCLSEGLIPLDKLMVETDSPYMGFANCRNRYMSKNTEFINSLNSKKKKRLSGSTYPNVPSSIYAVLEKTTQCLREHDPTLSISDVTRQTILNADAFFNLGLSNA